MNNSLRSIAALIAGVLIGGIVNYCIVIGGSFLVAPPPGVDMSDVASIAENIDQFGVVHFLVPFLAHALGTFAGALITFSLAVKYRRSLALTVGCVFLAGGISASFMIPAPVWFIAADLLLAYLPMAWLAIYLRQTPKAP